MSEFGSLRESSCWDPSLRTALINRTPPRLIAVRGSASERPLGTKERRAASAIAELQALLEQPAAARVEVAKAPQLEESVAAIIDRCVLN
jgi:hypothetical protein